MNLSRSLFRSFAILLALLLFLIGFSIFNFRRLSEADAWKAHTYTVLQASNRYYRAILDIDSAVRAFTISQKGADVGYQVALKDADNRLEELLFITRDNKEQQTRLEIIQKEKSRWIRNNLTPIMAVVNQAPNPTQALIRGGKMAPIRRQGLSRVVGQISAFEANEESLLKKRTADQNHWQTLTQITLWVGSFVSIFLTGALALFAARSSRDLDTANLRLTQVNAELADINARVTQTNKQLADEVLQRRAAESRLQNAVQELKRSNKELGEFAYVASHDLQEPLRAVAGCVQVLKKRYYNQLDAHADQFIEHAVDGAHRMQNLINDLLAYSRVGTRGKPFVLASGEEILNYALRNLSVQIAETGVQIERDPLPEIVCDAGQIEQLLQNLISNALKFRAGANPQVKIGYIREEDQHVFSVQDNGLGMEPQYFERIFVMFQRLHTRADFPGTGIGLAICKKIVERHGGSIWVQSAPGKGSTFFFSLPLNPIALPQIQETE